MTPTLVAIGVIVALAVVEWLYEQPPRWQRDFERRTTSDDYARFLKGGA